MFFIISMTYVAKFGLNLLLFIFLNTDHLLLFGEVGEYKMKNNSQSGECL